MSSLSTQILGKLMEATRLIHSHGYGLLHERIFRALDLLFEHSSHALELYDTRAGTHEGYTTMVFNTGKPEDYIQRAGELVPLEHPLFGHMVRRDPRPVQLSDYMTYRQFARTDLYNEVHKAAGTRHQLLIPFYSDSILGGITVNTQGRNEYTKKELLLASFIAPQIVTAFEADKQMKRIAPVLSAVQEVDYTILRKLGLTRRECETMCWIIQGKRDGEIAVILQISVRTVNQHVQAILKKLKVETRTAAVNVVMRAGFTLGGEAEEK